MNLAVFDIDGTLTLPCPVEDACFLGALNTVFGFDEVDADWTRYRDVTDSGLVHELCRARWGRGAADEELRRFRAEYCHTFLRRSGPADGGEIPGARTFVQVLLERPDWRVAVATGNFHPLALHKLERGGVTCQDAPMATADDAPSRAELVRRAVSRAEAVYGVAAFDHVVSIGDAPWDLRTARELQVPFVAVGERCGGPPLSTIADYLDAPAVLACLERAVCW